MAWRIHESVQRGEIDNRERGVVRGKVWLHGLAEPLALELKGNACPDLAGCLLTFENPGKTVPLRMNARMDPVQRGTVGDLTASRKVRVFDIPFEEAHARLKRKRPVPEHIANCLFLEWFSQANGRVVIESAEFRLTISPPAWTLSPEEEQQRQREAADGFSGFMNRLTAALEAARHEPAEDKEWDEFDYEKFLRESDAHSDKYIELFDKYKDHPDRERLIAREMGWTWLEEAIEEEQRRGSESEPVAPETIAPESDNSDAQEDDPFDFDELNRICAEAAENPPQPDPATEGVDWVRDGYGDVKHPLSLRALEGSMAMWRQCLELGLGETDDEDLTRLIGEYQTAGAKLAGALDGLAYGRDLREGAFIVAYLKRALGHLHEAQAALEKVAAKKLLSPEALTSTRAELFAVREEVLRLMNEFRRQS